MTSEIYVSGPALPPHGDAFEYVGVQTDMSRRDYFAAAALTGLLASGNYNEITMEYAATDALGYADALIAASKEADHA
ncbi:hypothetical protein [Afipia carboxidovorans]|uniref:hypothetical protein n=1 Tax=Afipia carboxidovorans TaxID=40137 RepID=UPI00308BDFBD|nr:hypothetical protein CRBSH125_09950 [Afipia carboxidovorans]